MLKIISVSVDDLALDLRENGFDDLVYFKI